jgi:hypothetical protein
MSGAVAAHAAYNGSGTQGLAVTNKIQDQEGDVMSVFWNKNDTTRQLLHGSTLLEVPASGNNGNTNFGGTKIFTINNDIDCLGEIYVHTVLDINVKDFVDDLEGSDIFADLDADNGIAATAVSSITSLKLKPGALDNIIERIEFQVGTQIWQTLEKDDVRVLYNTELSEAAFQTAARRAAPSVAPGTAFTTSLPVEFTFIIPSLTKTLAPQLENFSNISESGYPLAAAPHQSIKIKLYFATRPKTSSVSSDGTANSLTGTTTADMLTFGNDQYIESLKLTFSAGTYGTSVEDVAFVANLPITIKSVKMYAKHLIMCNEEREQMKAMPMGLPKRLKMTQNSVITDVKNVSQKSIDLDHFSLYASHLIISGDLGGEFIKSAELKLNSSSFSGVLPGQLLDYASAQSLGLYVNRNITGSAAAAPKEEQKGFGILVFPLASSAYSGSSVPFNRFDSIRLLLTFTGRVTANESYINITCVGETTALFKGGAASLAMY